MCLFATAFRTIPGCPILALINRDEFRTRQTAPPELVRDNQITWFGGTDLQAGGTWMGVNQFGLIVGVTNRQKSDVPETPRSRGWLCRDLLQCADTNAAFAEAKRLLSRHQFDGFNLLLLSAAKGLVVEAADEVVVRELSPGLHCIGNGTLDDAADRRVQGTHSELERLMNHDHRLEQIVSGAQQVCAQCGDDAWNSICRSGGPWGTVSSTIVAITEDIADVQYHYASGPPHDTPYDDYSPTVEGLLKLQS